MSDLGKEEIIGNSFGTALFLEALTPGKLSTVSNLKGLKDLHILKFLHTTPYLIRHFKRVAEKGINGEPLQFGEPIKKLMSEIMMDPNIMTNTALGYVMLATPLAYIMGKSIREGAIINSPKTLLTRYSSTIIRYLTSEKADAFYEAIKKASQKHLGKYCGKIPDVFSAHTETLNVSVWEVLKQSSYDDMIAKEITNGYPLTIKAFEHLTKETENGRTSLLNAISKTQRELLTAFPDTLIVKSWGTPTAYLVLGIAEIISRQDSLKYFQLFDRWLRDKGINPGTTSDIVATAVGLYLVMKHADNDNQ